MILVIGSRRTIPWLLRRASEAGHRNVDVDIKSRRNAKVERILTALEASAAAEGITLIRNRPGGDQRNVILRFPAAGDDGPSAGDMEPRQPLPTPLEGKL